MFNTSPIKKDAEMNLKIETEITSKLKTNIQNEIIDSKKESSPFKSKGQSKDKYDLSPYKQTNSKEFSFINVNFNV